MKTINGLNLKYTFKRIIEAEELGANYLSVDEGDFSLNTARGVAFWTGVGIGEIDGVEGTIEAGVEALDEANLTMKEATASIISAMATSANPDAARNAKASIKAFEEYERKKLEILKDPEKAAQESVEELSGFLENILNGIIDTMEIDSDKLVEEAEKIIEENEAGAAEGK